MAAATLTRKSLLERVETGRLLMRRGPPMVAFTCGSEDTGMRERDTCGAAFDPDGDRDGGETGESGTASESISGNGSRRAVRGDDDAVAEGAASTAAMRDSGESGDSGGRT